MNNKIIIRINNTIRDNEFNSIYMMTKKQQWRKITCIQRFSQLSILIQSTEKGQQSI